MEVTKCRHLAKDNNQVSTFIEIKQNSLLTQFFIQLSSLMS